MKFSKTGFCTFLRHCNKHVADKYHFYHHCKFQRCPGQSRCRGTVLRTRQIPSHKWRLWKFFGANWQCWQWTSKLVYCYYGDLLFDGWKVRILLSRPKKCQRWSYVRFQSRRTLWNWFHFQGMVYQRHFNPKIVFRNIFREIVTFLQDVTISWIFSWIPW